MTATNGMRYEHATDVAGEVIEAHSSKLKELSEYIHSNPELNFEEHKAHDAIVSYLKSLNISVTAHAYGLPTSFEAEIGTGGRVIVFNAEYDALPEIGHACGHNLIAVGSIAAFLATAAQLEISKVPGRVRLLGTPAEEGGGGKVILITKGAYKDVDACMMAHPAPLHSNYTKEFNGDVFRRQVACAQFDVHYKGKNAHAAFAPWQGINALDAVVLGYNGVSMLRQQMKPSDRIHGIIKDGGVKSNIIPDRSQMEYMVRTQSLAKNVELKQRVVGCFVGAATATGCELEIKSGPSYADMVPNVALCTLFTDEMAKLGLPMWNDIGSEDYVTGATDQGNVSYVVPSIHPNYGIPAGVGSYNHTVGFTEAAKSQEAFQRTMTVARGQAMSAWRILTDDAIANSIKKEFEEEQSKYSAQELASVYQVGDGMGKGVQVRCHCGHAME